jgi:hypothetical protein
LLCFLRISLHTKVARAVITRAITNGALLPRRQRHGNDAAFLYFELGAVRRV